MRYPLVLIFGLPLVCSPIMAQDQKKESKPGVNPPTVARALLVGTKILLANQEHYSRDRRVGRMRDDQLEDWQKQERKRLAKLRTDGESNVEWPYEGVYRVGGSVPPGYRVGGSAIACQALVLAPGFAINVNSKVAVLRSIEFMLDQLENNELLAPSSAHRYDVRGWAHTYALEFFLLAERKRVTGKNAERIKKMIPHLIRCLAKSETSQGGWNYANNKCSPFMTGSTLLALFQARKQGYEFDKGLVDRALIALEKSRAKTGSYVYSGIATPGRQRRTAAMPGACARAAIAELCLFRAGRSDAKRVRVAVDAFFEHWGELFKRKSKQGTHEGPYGIAPYYFIYGHTYAALAIEVLPEKDRPKLRIKMQEILWRTREKDGGWNDRIFPRSKSYTTAMAMLALLAPGLDPIPAWPQGEAGKKGGR
jgi:hypothetical protein